MFIQVEVEAEMIAKVLREDAQLIVESIHEDIDSGKTLDLTDNFDILTHFNAVLRYYGDYDPVTID